MYGSGMCAGRRRAVPLEKDPFEGNMICLFWGKTREEIEEKQAETRKVCALKNLWAFNRLQSYCFETIQSDISNVALRTADHKHGHTNKDRKINQGEWEEMEKKKESFRCAKIS